MSRRHRMRTRLRQRHYDVPLYLGATWRLPDLIDRCCGCGGSLDLGLDNFGKLFDQVRRISGNDASSAATDHAAVSPSPAR